MKEGIGSVVIPLPRYGDLRIQSKLLVSTQSTSPEEAQGKCRACITPRTKLDLIKVLSIRIVVNIYCYLVLLMDL